MNYLTIAILAIAAMVVVPFFAKKDRKDGYFDDQYDPHFRDNFKGWWED